VFYLDIFFLSSRRKKKKKPQRKKYMQKKGRSLPLSSCFALSLLALVFAFSLLHFYFKCFLLVSSFSQAKKKNNVEKKTQREKKKKNK
jgi:hypothetical protein